MKTILVFLLLSFSYVVFSGPGGTGGIGGGGISPTIMSVALTTGTSSGPATYLANEVLELRADLIWSAQDESGRILSNLELRRRFSKDRFTLAIDPRRSGLLDLELIDGRVIDLSDNKTFIRRELRRIK